MTPEKKQYLEDQRREKRQQRLLELQNDQVVDGLAVIQRAFAGVGGMAAGAGAGMGSVSGGNALGAAVGIPAPSRAQDRDDPFAASRERMAIARMVGAGGVLGGASAGTGNTGYGAGNGTGTGAGAGGFGSAGAGAGSSGFGSARAGAGAGAGGRTGGEEGDR